MAPRKQRVVGRLAVEGPATPQTSLYTQAVNTHGFPALAHEIYLEIISQIPSLPIPTPWNITANYPEIRRSRHETLLSLSQTCHSLRSFFQRFLWQRIEVREGMIIKDGNDISGATPYLQYGDKNSSENYATELVRQLEIVTVRNPQLAQYVNYLDVLIVDHAIGSVLPELARCLSLFPNLHTVQMNVTLYSRRSLRPIFKRAFKKYSYPQIRNVFVSSSQSFLSSCPEARRVGCTHGSSLYMPILRTIIENCPRLEVLENFPEILSSADTCKLVLDSFPHLRTVTVSFPEGRVPDPIDILKRLNHPQTIIIHWKPVRTGKHWTASSRPSAPDGLKEEWTEQVKHVQIEIQRRDSLENVAKTEYILYLKKTTITSTK